MTPDPFARAETGCHFLESGDLDGCEKERHCPFAFQRRREEVRDNDGKGPQRQRPNTREIQEDSRAHLIDNQGAIPASPSEARVCGREIFRAPLSCQREDPDGRR
jgi:hypothetical protein